VCIVTRLRDALQNNWFTIAEGRSVKNSDCGVMCNGRVWYGGRGVMLTARLHLFPNCKAESSCFLFTCVNDVVISDNMVRMRQYLFPTLHEITSRWSTNLTCQVERGTVTPNKPLCCLNKVMLSFGREPRWEDTTEKT
jgi:hypothetical protein